MAEEGHIGHIEHLGPIGPVDIRLPPDPSLSRVLRLAASGIASLAEFTVDEIEDIKLAVSEVLLALVEHGSGAPVEVRLSVAERSFDVRGRTAVETFDPQHPDLVLCRAVLAGVCDSSGIELVDHWLQIDASIVRSATG